MKTHIDIDGDVLASVQELGGFATKREAVNTALADTIEQSGQTLLEFDVSQLGQILRAKTLIGYSLAPDDVVP